LAGFEVTTYGRFSGDHRGYIGMDVHQASISIAVSDAAGKVLMERIIETKAATVLEFIQGLRGSLSVTFEEGPVPPGCTTCSSPT
jgi:hypothetical protein